MNDQKIKELYGKYINIPLYRVVPISDYKIILKEGINPKDNPYKKIKPSVLKLEKIIKTLDKKGIKIILNWGKDVSGIYALGVTLTDLSINCVDFSPRDKDVSYYLNFKGGAATANLKNIINQIKERKIVLSKSDLGVVNKIENFIKKRTCENVAFSINGTSKFLESAFFQPKPLMKKNSFNSKHPTHFESPFGSYAHFRKLMLRKYSMKYLYFLRTKKFFLRVREKIPKEEIKCKM